jgi:flagellar hook-associated protein 1 FlgK
MSFGFGIGSGLRALEAARFGMQIAGNNVANANTPGYSRQRIDLAAAMPYAVGSNLQIGTGVEVRGITRLVDDGLEQRMQLQLGLVGSAELDQSTSCALTRATARCAAASCSRATRSPRASG